MSNPVGSSLALTNIADGSQIVAADHRNNYSAIQTEVNDLVACLSGGVAGQLLQAPDSSHVAWVYPPGYELGYDQITTPVNVVSTTESAGTTIIACAAHVFDGAPVIARFCSPAVLAPAASNGFVILSLFEGVTQVGRFATVFNALSTANIQAPVAQDFRITPTVGSHTYTVTAYASSTTGSPSVAAGTGGTSSYLPASIRFTKA